MITERDLAEAIAECEGTRNPNANTCIKLAAFYTIKRELFGEQTQMPAAVTQSYSYALPQTTEYISSTEFGKIISGKDQVSVLSVVDELMTTLQVINPRLYQSVVRKLENL